MAVCGDPKARHGIILAKNEHAKRYGVQTAETIYEARRKCPSLVLVRAHHELYNQYSKEIFSYYNTFTNQVEPFGLDEAWLDVSGSQKLFGSGFEIAEQIRRGVKEKFGLTVSVGVSFNKVFAKLASDYKKPDATTVFSPSDWKEKIFPLPVGSLLSVGHTAEEKFSVFGVKTIGDLARLNPLFLSENFGKTGEMLSRYANGLDDSAVCVFGQGDPIKSIGNSFTFPRDLEQEDEVNAGLRALADKVASRLRAHRLYATSVSITVRDNTLHTITRQMPLKTPTHLSDDLFDAAKQLLKASRTSDRDIRMLGISANKLTDESAAGEQISLFDAPEQPAKKQRKENREGAVDRIRQKFGSDSIRHASTVSNDIFGDS